MPTATPIKGFYEPGDNEVPYGANWRAGFARMVDKAFEFKTIALTGDKILTSTDYADNESRALALRFTGAGPHSVTLPSKTSFWIIRNDCSSNLTINSLFIVQPGGMVIVAYTGSAFIELYNSDYVVNRLNANTFTGLQTFQTGPRYTMSALTSGTTITPAFGAVSGRYTLALGHNATLANPTGLSSAVGSSGWIAGEQDATGGRTLAFGGQWFATNDSQPIPTAAGAKFRIDYHVVSTSRVDYTLRTVA